MTNTTRFTTVAQAAKFLDEKVEGWAKNIDLNTLDMFVSHRCVLGQVFGNAEKGYLTLRLNNEEAFVFGWSKDNEWRVHLPNCTALWIEEIKARLAPAKTRQQELEDMLEQAQSSIAAMQKELEDLKNPMISVTLSKSDWFKVCRQLSQLGYNYDEINKAAFGEQP